MAESASETFARKLNHLLEHSAQRNGVVMSLSQFCADLETRTGTTVSKAYLAALRKGRAPEPRLDLVRALASYFGVSPMYFLDRDEPDPGDRDDVLVAMERAGVRQIGLRAAMLSDQSLQHLAAIIDGIRAMEDPGPPAGDHTDPQGTG